MLYTASGLHRLSARIIDLIFYLPIFYWYRHYPSGESIWFFVLITTIYIAFFECFIPFLTKGQTIGKLLTNIRIVSQNGAFASFNQITDKGFIYLLIPVIEALPVMNSVLNVLMIYCIIVSLILMFNDPYNQTMVDKLSFTYVVINDRSINVIQEKLQSREYLEAYQKWLTENGMKKRSLFSRFKRNPYQHQPSYVKTQNKKIKKEKKEKY
jgi:uncharacterized RDD family membrane protein YckC